MKNYLVLLIIFVISSNVFAHTGHYEGIKKIEMDVLRNNEVIGYSNYFFEKNDDVMIVKNYTNFKIELFGVVVFSILGESEERYENDQLTYFKSNTFQNDKEKYVNLKFNKSLNNFIIDGSSFKGNASIDCIIGNWWNHKIFKATKQISPLSGSIKKQIVNFVKEENILINNKKYLAKHYNIKSNDPDLQEDKKFNFDVWYDPINNIIIKVAYSKMGDWEYKLRNFE